jgi:hypothetical protein
MPRETEANNGWSGALSQRCHTRHGQLLASWQVLRPPTAGAVAAAARTAPRNDSKSQREGQGTRWVTGRAGAPPHSRSGPRRIHPCAASRRGPRRRRARRRLNRGRPRQSGGRQVPRYGRRRRRSGHRRRKTGPWPAGRRKMDGQRTDGPRMRTGRRLTGDRKADTPGTGTRGTDTPGTGTRGTDIRAARTRGAATRAPGTRGMGSNHATGSRRGLGTRRVTGGGQETTDGGLVRGRTILIRPRLAPRMRISGPHNAPGQKVSARKVPVTQWVHRLPARRPPQVQGLSSHLPQNGARKG